MFDSKTLFGIAAILFGAGFFVRSFSPAHAFQSPVVQLGANPIENIQGVAIMSGNSTSTIWTNNTSDDFIVTTVLFHTNYCKLTVDGNTDGLAQIPNYGKMESNMPSSAFIQGNAKLKLSPNSTLDFLHYGSSTHHCNYYMEGYYVHP